MTTRSSESRRTPRGGARGRTSPRAARSSTRASSSSTRRSASRPRASRSSGVRLHWGRLALLALVLFGAALYVGPLRDFFAQQDRYQKEASTLQELKRQNTGYHQRLADIKDKQWVVKVAREDFGLVPPGMQSFVVKGLPAEPPARTHGTPNGQSLSLGDRLKDLWNTLLN
jgi:cell division protein FtsB